MKTALKQSKKALTWPTKGSKFSDLAICYSLAISLHCGSKHSPLEPWSEYLQISGPSQAERRIWQSARGGV